MKAPRSQLASEKMPASKTVNLATRFFFMCPLYTIFPYVHIKIHEGDLTRPKRSKNFFLKGLLMKNIGVLQGIFCFFAGIFEYLKNLDGA